MRPPEVEQVAALAALVEGPELGREELIELVRVHDGAVADRQVRDGVEAWHDMPEVLVAVDLDLDLPDGTGLGLEAEADPWVLARVRARGADPLEHPAQSRQHGADRTRLALDEVDVLGIPGRGREVELVERRAAAERERLIEGRVAEDVEQG